MKKLASRLQGIKAQAAGARFEDIVEHRLDALEHDGIVAHWTHNQPAFKRIGERRFVPVEAGDADYTGMFTGGLYWALEAKSSTDPRFPLERIEMTQILHLDNVARSGGLAFLALQFRVAGRARDFLIPWSSVPWKTARTAQAVYLEDLADWEVPAYAPNFFDPFVWSCSSCLAVHSEARRENQKTCACWARTGIS